MKNNKLNFALILFASLLLFAACEKDKNNPTPLEPVTVEIDATSYSDWVYFSFATGDVVTVAEPLTSTEWDIALKRNHFRTNSGTSGGGEGGALDAGAVNFDDYDTAPTTGYTVDTSIDVFDFATMEYSPEPGNTVLETWGEFSDAMPPTLVPSNNVFVVKGADGKYAKMVVQNYYGTNGSGYVTFTFVYQPDGSVTLK